MAFVVKDARKRSPNWYACFRSADGRWLKKSTGETSKSRALIVTDTLQRAEDLGAQGSATEARLRDLLSDSLQRLTGTGLRAFSVAQWLEHFSKQKRKSRSKKTADKHAQLVRDFLEFLGQRARVNIAAITSRDILGFRDHRERLGLAPGTLNDGVKMLSAAFNMALREGLISVNPCVTVEAVRDRHAAHKNVFTPEQVSALVAAADGDWRGAILIGFYTGQRLGDVCTLRWRDVDLAENKTITFEQGKTGRKVVVPIYSELENYLLNGLSTPHSNNAFLFPTLARFESTSPLSKEFRAIMEKANIAQSLIRERTKGGRVVTAYSFHSLRHSFSSILANAGVAEEIRMKLTGHTTRDVHQRYSHHDLDVLRDAIARLPKISGASS